MEAILPLPTRDRFPALTRERVESIQVNLTYRCNQSCRHCHVAAGPYRLEAMSSEVVADVIRLVRSHGVRTLDLTGGAPELHPDFRSLVASVRSFGVQVVDRCNLTVLEEPGQEDLPEFLAAHEVRIIGSLPCYLEENVDRQRGAGVHRKSIRALQSLNALGYGKPGGRLTLDLVYNPPGPSLPPPQQELERVYKAELLDRYGITFDRLLTIANMPIARFASALVAAGKMREYLGLLRSSHRDENLGRVMCRRMLSVDWRGYAYDCDFNQMLDLALAADGRSRNHVRDLIHVKLEDSSIQVSDHCYGCTAGQGSSCAGALSEPAT